MKLFTVDFKPIFPTGSALVIKANSLAEAESIASETLTFAGADYKVTEVDMSTPGIVVYFNGDY